MLFVLVVAFAADRCRGYGLSYKLREYYDAAPPSKIQTLFNVPAYLVILLPTMTNECDISNCSSLVKDIQINDMNNRNMADLAEK